MYSVPCSIEGAFLYALPREVKYTDKKDGTKKSFKFWQGELMTSDQRIINIQLPDDPKLQTGEVISLTGYVKYDSFKKDLVFSVPSSK